MTVQYTTTQPAQRDVGSAMGRGLKGRCPACGEGRMFGRFLKVNDHCPACGEALHHQRADDAPPYVVITIVGHVVLGLALGVEKGFQPDMWLHAVMWLPLTLVMSLALLQPVKGALVGLQWALRMHGFEPDSHEAESTSDRRTT